VNLKLDENLGRQIARALSEAGHDVATVAGEGLAGSADQVIFRAAVDEDRTLVTLDLDFSNPLRFPTSGTAGVIVVRAPRPLVTLVRESLLNALPQIDALGASGNLYIVEPGRFRQHRSWEDDDDLPPPNQVD
jgi:predicted nuclease of predicted toxin-antitoxin system